ncbi:MAG: hypothetical protein IK085_09620 [Clostridia bacterium]|nr:hypothetical protein [Clostridia bacterium]
MEDFYEDNLISEPEPDHISISVQNGDEKLYDAEFNRFAGFLTEMILKYGPTIDP